MKRKEIIVTTVGMNNRLDPIEIPYSEEDGASALATADNVRITDSGTIERRQGPVQILSGDFSALYPLVGGEALCVRELSTTSELLRLNRDDSVTGLRSGMTKGQSMFFTRVGPRVYYSNTKERGYVEAGLSRVWPTSTYSGPATTRPFSAAPIGSRIFWYRGRMWVVDDDAVFWSEPYDVGLFDLMKNFVRFATRVTMARPVDDGIYFSDETETSFLPVPEGNPAEMSKITVSSVPACEGTDVDVKIDTKDTQHGNQGMAAMWTSSRGVHLGLNGGVVLDDTRNNMRHDVAKSGAALLAHGNFIYTMR